MEIYVFFAWLVSIWVLTRFGTFSSIFLSNSMTMWLILVLMILFKKKKNAKKKFFMWKVIKSTRWSENPIYKYICVIISTSSPLVLMASSFSLCSQFQFIFYFYFLKIAIYFYIYVPVDFFNTNLVLLLYFFVDSVTMLLCLVFICWFYSFLTFAKGGRQKSSFTYTQQI